MSQIVQLQAVAEDGTIHIDALQPGTRYVLLRAPKMTDLAVEKLQRPRAMLDEVVAYVREHRELGKRQYREFAERYGDPREKVQRYADLLSREEFENRVREFNHYVQTRFEDLARDVEGRYDNLEKEFDATLERLFGRETPTPTEKPNPETTSDLAAPQPTKDTPAKDAPAKDAPAKDAPAKDAPAKDAPKKTPAKKQPKADA